MYSSGLLSSSSIGGSVAYPNSNSTAPPTAHGSSHARSRSTDYANALQFSQHATTGGFGHSVSSRTFGASISNTANSTSGGYPDRFGVVYPLSPSAFMTPAALGTHTSTGFSSASLVSGYASPDYGFRGTAESSRRARTASRHHSSSSNAGRRLRARSQEGTWRQSMSRSRRQSSKGRKVAGVAPTPESVTVTVAPVADRSSSGRASSNSVDPSFFTVGSTGQDTSAAVSSVANDNMPAMPRRLRASTRKDPLDGSRTVSGRRPWRSLRPSARYGSPDAMGVSVHVQEAPTQRTDTNEYDTEGDYSDNDQQQPAPHTLCAYCQRRKRQPLSSPGSTGTARNTHVLATPHASGNPESLHAGATDHPARMVAERASPTPSSMDFLRYCDALFACPCGGAWYCGPPCQRAHWATHKRENHESLKGAAAGLECSAAAPRSGKHAKRMTRRCWYCGVISADLMVCRCGDAFYCGPACQRADWPLSHVFHCRLVSQQALLQRVLELDTPQAQQRLLRGARRGQDAATQTMPEVVAAPGVNIRSGLPRDAPADAGVYLVGNAFAGCGEQPLSSSNDTNGGDVSRRRHFHDPLSVPGDMTTARHRRDGSGNLSDSATERSGHVFHSLHDGSSVQDRPELSSGTALAGATGIAGPLGKYSLPTSTRVGNDLSHRDPSSSTYHNGADRSRRYDNAAQSTHSTHANGATSVHHRRSARYPNQSVRSLRESGYASFFAPATRQSSRKSHGPDAASSSRFGGGTYDDGEEAMEMQATAYSSQYFGGGANASSVRDARSAVAPHQQLPSLTAFFSASRKVQLEEEAHQRAELYRQFIIRRADIAMAALKEEEAEARMTLVTEEVMDTIRNLHPAAKAWRERLFNYYYK